MKVGTGSKVYETAKIVEGGRTWKAQVDIGENCLVGDFCFVALRKLVMDHGSQIGPHAILSGGGEVKLGRFSVVGFGAQLITGTDTTAGRYMCEAAPLSDRHVVRGSITLGEGTYIGSGAVICVSSRCPNIAIGDFSVVGSMSYIDKSVPANTIIYPKVEYVTKRRQ